MRRASAERGRRLEWIRIVAAFVLFLSSTVRIGASTPPPPPATNTAKLPTNSISLAHVPPKIAREFRGAWVATIGNIDWPSKPGLPVEQQKAELRALMEKAADLGLNALIFQVRPMCDAFYQSGLEPWSEYLNGESGKAPNPSWDPLKYAVEQAHARGLELHAWFNPYRAGLTSSKLSARHISKTQPRWVRRYGNFLWLDPTEQGVQDYTTRVILDVVKRYDIDGVHLDDYFYPYPEKDSRGALLDFPDGANWARYRKSGGTMERGDWRRDHVNRLVRRLKTEIHQAKSWVTFGISPFGIWRPGSPQQIRGLDAYDLLYADARHWLVNGWVDYLAPQLYWTIERPETSYSALLSWWRSQDQRGIPIWPGGAVTHVATTGANWPAQEILRQIDLTRESARPGYVHWNISALNKSPPALREALRQKVYSQTAFVPSNPGDTGDVHRPFLTVKSSRAKHQLSWSVPVAQRVAFWVLQSKVGDEWRLQVLPHWQKEIVVDADPDLKAVALTCLSRHRNLSPAALRVFQH